MRRPQVLLSETLDALAGENPWSGHVPKRILAAFGREHV